MKIYRTDTIGEYSNLENAREQLKCYPDATIWPTKEKHSIARWIVTIRREFSHDLELSDKQVAKMLPAWAKHKAPPSIGHKVTAFYAINNKVVTDCSGIVIGSDEYYEWQETQPDPFRGTYEYLYGATPSKRNYIGRELIA